MSLARTSRVFLAVLCGGIACAADRLTADASADAPPGTPAAQATDGALGLAAARIAAEIAAAPLDSPSQVVVVYFTPRDKAPAADHVARIRRIVGATADFYQQELARHGFADRAMNVLRDASGEVDVVDVVGADDERNYGKQDGGKIRAETLPALRRRGVDPERSVLLIFCNLMTYDPVAGTISHNSPYYGGGSYLSGNAWQCDSEILDPLRLQDPTPLRDGEYGRITIGRHNSIFIGGVIHELGHALALPHCRERRDEAVRGTALMGSGNRTFGEQLRGEGQGTFLTQAHALRLAAHPAFLRQVAGSLYDRPQTTWPTLRIEAAENGGVRIQGAVASDTPVHGVVAYFDPAGGSDYDATTASAVPDATGRFALQGEPLRAGVAAELRLVACHVNGAASERRFSYRVDANGQPDLTAIRTELELAPLIEALRADDLTAAGEALAAFAEDDPLRSLGERLLTKFRDIPAPTSLDAEAVPSSQMAVALSTLRPASARVGWLRPTYDGVPEAERLLKLDGQYYAQGIYAHAPAEHAYRLARGWRRLVGRCGLQDGHGGRVGFTILGDGQTLWQTSGVTQGEGAAFDVDVSDVDVLTLRVDDGGDGTGADWGVWIEPQLTRP